MTSYDFILLVGMIYDGDTDSVWYMMVIPINKHAASFNLASRRQISFALLVSG